MKKLKLAFITVLFAAVMLSGCARKDDFADGFAPELTLSEFMTAKTEYPEYDGNVEEIKLIITNNGSEEWGYNVVFHLEKYDEDMDGWRNINFSRQMEWTLLSMGVLPSETVAEIISLKDNFKQPLLPGRYRVVKYGDRDEAVAAEFKIK